MVNFSNQMLNVLTLFAYSLFPFLKHARCFFTCQTLNPKIPNSMLYFLYFWDAQIMWRKVRANWDTWPSICNCAEYDA